MGDAKKTPSRLRTFRESVKKITDRLAEGDSETVKKSDDVNREVERLRAQIQSMEDELGRLYQSRYQLEQANKQNEKLAATLQEAKTKIEALRAEVEKLNPARIVTSTLPAVNYSCDLRGAWSSRRGGCDTRITGRTRRSVLMESMWDEIAERCCS